MKKMACAVLHLLVVLPMFAAVPGCAQNNARKSPPDPVIENYMHHRSQLVAQRRRLAQTYGPNSAQAAQADRQIQLVDEAMAQRRQQLVEQERARQQVQQLKSDTAPLPEGSPASHPAGQRR